MNMRALCVHNESLGSLIVLELDHMRYVDNIKSAKMALILDLCFTLEE